MSMKRDFPIGRLLTGFVLVAGAFLFFAFGENRLLASVAGGWGVLFLISAALNRTEFGQLLGTSGRDERQLRVEAIASQNAFMAVVVAAVAIVASDPEWTAPGTAALVMISGMAVYLGSLAYGAARK